MKSISIEASSENLEQVNDFISSQLEEYGCSMKVLMQVQLAVEEVFINVAQYAYTRGNADENARGDVVICIEKNDVPPYVDITFKDRGIPFDPLMKEDPDITLSAGERQIGGLGIYLVKKSMDHVNYEYSDGQNILTLRKNL